MKSPKLIQKDPVKNIVGYRSEANEATRKVLNNVIFNGLYFKSARKIATGIKLGDYETRKVLPILIDAGYVENNKTIKLTKLGESYVALAD